jgi:hypothetical protein
MPAQMPVDEQGTGSNSREKNIHTFEGTSRLHTGPVRMQVRPVTRPKSAGRVHELAFLG